MTKILSLCFLLCLLFPSAFGQTVILTKEQNNKWLDSFKILPLNGQLLAIKDRLFSDTNVFVRQSYPDGIKVIDSLGGRVYGDGKPLLIICGYLITIDNKTQTDKVVGLTKLLTQTYIKEISVLTPSAMAATAIYGTAGQFGIIAMTLTKKKYGKLFKRLELKPNY